MEKIRLQKYFTDCGILSRRAAERAIEAGEVLVNGKPATLGCKIDPLTDLVTYRGRAIRRRGCPFTYIMLNKPRGVLTSVSDDRGRPCVTDLVADAGGRVYPVGRLDLYSEGLLILTDDGEFANFLTHPKHHIPKRYRVKIKGQVPRDKLQALGAGMVIDGYQTIPAVVAVIEEAPGHTLLELTLFEGRNRQIRKMCAQLGLVVMGLRRVAVGDVTLGSLPPGKWRHLTEDEVASLKNFKPKDKEHHAGSETLAEQD